MTVARVYHNQTNIYRLTAEQIEDLDRRLTARIDKATRPVARIGERGAKKQQGSSA